MTELKKYIEENFGGNQAAFSRAIGDPSATNVNRQIKRGFIVTNEGWIINPRKTKRISQPELSVCEACGSNNDLAGQLKGILSDFNNPKNWTRPFNSKGKLIDEFALYIPKLP